MYECVYHSMLFIIPDVSIGGLAVLEGNKDKSKAGEHIPINVRSPTEMQVF